MVIGHIKLLAAAQQVDLDRWQLGDALVTDCRYNPRTGGPLAEDKRAVLAVTLPALCVRPGDGGEAATVRDCATGRNTGDAVSSQRIRRW
jgi:hypothetical protein